MRSKEVDAKKVDVKKAAKLLQEDILNSTLHCFGSHHKCKADYCKTVRANQSSVHSPIKDAVSSSDTVSPTSSNVPSDEPSFDVSQSPDTSSLSFSSSSSDTSSPFPIGSTQVTSDSSSITDTSSSSLSDLTESTSVSTDVLMSSTPLSSIVTIPEDEVVNTLLLEQQKSWEDATTDTQIDLPENLDPPVPLDNSMICDIQKIAGRLAAKSNQLLGMYVSHNLY